MLRKIVQKIKLEDYSYDIVLSKSIVQEILGTRDSSKTFYVVDRNIFDTVTPLFDMKNLFLFDADEKHKTLESVIKIEQFLYDKKALRDSLLVSIGGGITGDLAGFAASIYMRGIDFIQIPTTLLSMVDSSVGGKTGVNFCGVKNNIGSFYQPKKVIIDIDFLSTLSKQEFLNGVAESIKIALVADKKFFDFIVENKSKILEREDNAVLNLIERSVQLKSEIVTEDTLERGRRKLLNFGHTIAHAIETDSDNQVSHGFAVALGMVYEMKYGVKAGLVDLALYGKVRAVLESFSFPTVYKVRDRERFLVALNKDKKATEKGISLVLTDNDLVGKIIDCTQAAELVAVFE